MLRRWIPALMLAACCLAFFGCQDSASAQNTIAPAQLSQQEQDILTLASGTTTAVIVVRLQAALGLPESVALSVAVTALVSGLTIGGKALGKTVALNKSTSVVYWVGRFLHLFHR